MLPQEDDEDIDRIAAGWVARLDRGALTSEDDGALTAWLAADTRHSGAFARASAIFAYSERARALGAGFDPAGFRAVSTGAAPRRALTRRWLLAGGAAAAAVAGAGGLSYTYLLAAEYRTRRGEIRVIPLADGSVMTLNTASTVAVRLTPLRRGVRLLEGEALFDVAKDPERPFVATAGNVDVRAVGTSFAVRSIGTAPMEVLVREGTVDMLRQSSTPVSPLRVPAFTRAVAVDAAGVSAQAIEVGIHPDALARQLSWREGMIAFEGISLGQVAEEFRRYSDARIVIDDPGVAALAVTGRFSAYDPQGFARAVAASLGLQVGVTASGAVMLWK